MHQGIEKTCAAETHKSRQETYRITAVKPRTSPATANGRNHSLKILTAFAENFLAFTHNDSMRLFIQSLLWAPGYASRPNSARTKAPDRRERKE
jgi:hypothetical protein